jgi:hypothetical protein
MLCWQVWQWLFTVTHMHTSVLHTAVMHVGAEFLNAAVPAVMDMAVVSSITGPGCAANVLSSAPHQPKQQSLEATHLAMLVYLGCMYKSCLRPRV